MHCVLAIIFLGGLIVFELLTFGVITVKTCSVCGANFQCGDTEANGKCWCNALPNIVPISNSSDCLCPTCLKLKIEQIEAGKSLSFTG